MAVHKNIRDINPLEHITADLAKSRFNYESILNGIVEWNNSKLDTVTVRLATDTDPYYVDYTFPTKQGYAGDSKGFADSAASVAGAFSESTAYDLPALYDPSDDQCDTVKVRITAADNGGASWSMYAMAVIYDEGSSSTSTRDYCKNLYIRLNGMLCRTVTAVSKGGAWSSKPYSSDTSSNWMQVVTAYSKSDYTYYCNANDPLVSYAGAVYRISGQVSASLVPSSTGSGWSKVCDILASGVSLVQNGMYYSNGEFYIYTGSSTTYDGTNVPTPATDTASLYWKKPSVYYMYVMDASATVAARWRVTTDISGLILRMDEDSAAATSVPDISAMANLEVHTGSENDTSHKGVAIFDTCNYSLWPSSDSAIWTSGSTYSTDASIPATQTQEYTAKMVFHHSDSDTKTMNIVNYDGPDLDQGLAIYLPIQDKVIVNGVSTFKTPCDGYTMEFLFRIWPNAEYNGASTSDLIINKAHIYVYSVPSSDSLDGVAPIAKFSMARLTNFYVFAENIGVPNRPVLYKTKFVYNARNGEWETYDYYQFPDHIFLSPKGFVDPMDRSTDTYGVETAGFPLFQDPFSDLDLSRVMPDETYLNRMR